MALSYACLLGTLFLFLKIARHGNPTLGIAASLALLLSRAFMDYSSSGLENPLLHLLLCAYVLVAVAQQDAERRFLHTSLVYSLIFLTRPDAIFLITPASLWMLWLCGKQGGWQRSARLSAIAVLPVVAWELFSLIYYGSLVPNTAIAKTNLGYARTELLLRGLDYFTLMLGQDAATVIIIVLAGAAVCLRCGSALPKLLMGGVALQILYIFYIGGDYMAGRFLTTSVLISALTLSMLQVPKTRGSGIHLALAGGGIAVFLLLCAAALRYFYIPLLPLTENLRFSKFGVISERIVYDTRLKMLSVIRHRKRRPYLVECMGVSGMPGTRVGGAMGMTPWMCGRQVHFIDFHALTDPYLARLPSVADARIGHYERRIPRGYIESIITGRNAIVVPILAALYDDVALATRGQLFSWKRWQGIWRLNTGFYRIEDVRQAAASAGHDTGTSLRPTLDFGAPPAFLMPDRQTGADAVTALKQAIIYGNAADMMRELRLVTEPQRAASLTRAARDLWFLIVSQAKNGRDEKFKMLLEAGADFRTVDRNGLSAFDTALLLEYTDGVRMLLAKGLDVNAADDAGMTALMYAAYRNEINLLQWLLARGANVNAADTRGETALMKAALWGHTEIIRLLLRAGADIDAAKKDGSTALLFALVTGEHAVVQTLLEGGATLEAALIPAAAQGRLDIVKFLVGKGANIDARDAKSEATPLIAACQGGYDDVIMFLLGSGADPNALDRSGDSALAKTVARRHADTFRQLDADGLRKNGYVARMFLSQKTFTNDIVGALLGAGADVNAALRAAAQHGRFEDIDFLRRRGADMNILDSNQRLLYDAHYGHSGEIRALLDAGADIDATDMRGETALMNAALQGHAEAVGLLVERGANLDITSKSGETALSLALFGRINTLDLILYERNAAADILASRGADTGNALALAVKHGFINSLAWLLGKGVDINAALSRAAASGHIETLQYLLRKGANPDVTSDNGSTALMEAASRGHTGMVRVLLAHGADVHRTNKNDETALQIATRKSYADIAAMLRDAGARD